MRRVACSGAPRDLGRDQGVALGEELRRQRVPGRLRALADRLGVVDPAARRLSRELRRYFPHQAEWLEGLARAARMPVVSLVRALAASCGPAAPPGPVVLARAPAGPAARVARPVPRTAVLRRVAPEGRFRSVELALPSGSSALLGVNEAGLAVAVLPGCVGSGRFAAPTALFARDCLERFEHVDPALEWCLSRPAARGGALLLADARGETAGVDCAGPRRRALRPGRGWLVLGGPEARELAKTGGEATDLDVALAAALGASAAGALAVADPRGRRLRVGDGGWVEA